MKIMPDKHGRFGKRLYFESPEFDEMMDDLRMRVGVDVFQEGSGIDVDLVLYKAFGLEPDFVHLPTGVLGRTVFDQEGHARVELSRDLDEASHSDELARRRLRTTLAHEVGHVACHSTLFIEDTATMSLFPDDNAPAHEDILCREASVGSGDERRYQGEWWEYQANQCMASLLLPRKLFGEKVQSGLESRGAASFDEVIRKGSAAKAVRSLSDCFDVSQEAVFYRLQDLGHVANLQSSFSLN